MSSDEERRGKKREIENENDSSSDEWVGPKRTEVEENKEETNESSNGFDIDPNLRENKPGDDDDDDGSEAKSEVQIKRRKSKKNFVMNNFLVIICDFLDEDIEIIYLANLPSAESYEKSYMHRDTISHLVVTV